MQSVSTVTVINVKRQRRHSKRHHRHEGTGSHPIRVTRVKSRSHGSFKKSRQSVPAVDEINIPMVDVNVSSKNLHNNIKTPSIKRLQNDVNRPQFSYAITEKNPLGSRNHVATPIISPMTSQLQDPTHNLPISRSVKVAPINNYDPLQSENSSSLNSFPTTKQTLNKIKSSRFSIGDRREIYTIGKEHTKRKGCSKLCSPLGVLILVLLALSLIVAAVVPATIITLKKTTKSTITVTTTTATTTTTTTGTTTTVTTATTTTTTATTTTTTGTTSTTTASTTTISTTTGPATVTITSNICTSTTTSVELVASCYPCNTVNFYYNFVYTYTALSNVTRIEFAIRRETLYFALDSVSVMDYLAPTTELIVNGGFEAGNLASWVYCNQNNATSTGGVKSNYTYSGFTYYPQTGTYYYVGGSNVSADYLSQTFPTQIGHTYNVSFWVMIPAGGNSTSGDFFLGV